LSNIIDGRTAETCNIYNMLKLTRRLFALEPKVDYAEFEERALFNHILGSIDPGDGAMCYMVPVGRGYRREYQDMNNAFTCCVGSGMESHALHGDGIYYESGDRFWVNLYAPSTARWDGATLTLAVDTNFPEGESATLKMTLTSPEAFTLALRRPSWAGDGFRVAVNGAAVKQLAAAGAYVEIKREWKTGDVVTLALPKALRLEPLKDDRRRAAIMWGPLVLAGDLGPQPDDRGRGNDDDQALPRARPEAPALVAANRPVTEWVKPVSGKPGTFRTDGVGRRADVELTPFYRLHRRAYAAYWDVLTPADYESHVAAANAERERQKRLDAATIGSVPIGDAKAEKNFSLQGEASTIVRADGRPGRRAGRWFSFEVPIDAPNAAALVATYNSDTRQPRAFEILVDGTRVGEQKLEKSSVSKFFDVEYPLPADVVKGKQKIVVRFQGIGTSEVAPVFALRVIRGLTPR
jgi:hypothetical protein